MDKEELICEATFSYRRLENILQNALQTKAEFSKCSSERIGQLQGFLSRIVKVEIEWSKRAENESLPKSVVLKIPSTKNFDELGEMVEMVKEMADELKFFDRKLAVLHNTECAMYRFAKGHEKELRMALCYFWEEIDVEKGQQGLLVLEDLSEVGYVKRIWESPDLSLLEDVVAAQAAYHAFSLRNQQWKGKVNTKFSDMFDQQDLATMSTMTEKCVNMLKTEYSNHVAPYLADTLMNYCNFNDMSYINDLPKEMNVPPVLVQGDFWVSNIIVKRDEEGKERLLAVIDWQVGHAGSTAEDLARFLCSSVNSKVRRENTKHLLDHYYESLVMEFAKFDQQPPFTKEQIVEAFRQAFKFGVLFIVGVLPMMASNDALLGTDPENERKELLDRTRCLLEDLRDWQEGKSLIWLQ